MRFHLGPVPEDENFKPQQEGWSGIREPGPLMINLLAIPVAFGIMVFTLALLWLAFPLELLTADAIALQPPGWIMLLIFVLIIPVHEFLHALFHPGWGQTNNTVIGYWASHFLFYASYEGPLSRNRFLFIFFSPYLFLSLLPIGGVFLLRLLQGPPQIIVALSALSIIGGVLSCGDFIGFVLVLAQIPAHASVRNQGWRTYWKLAAAPE